MTAKAIRPVTRAGKMTIQITRLTTVTVTALPARTRVAALSTAAIIKRGCASARFRRAGRRRARTAAALGPAPEAPDGVGHLVVGHEAVPVDRDVPRDATAVVAHGELVDPRVDRVLDGPVEAAHGREAAERPGWAQRAVVAHEQHDGIAKGAEAAAVEGEAVVVDPGAVPAAAGSVEGSLGAAVRNPGIGIVARR